MEEAISLKIRQAMSEKLKLTDREWREFSVGSLFDVFTGANIPQKNLSIGIVPRISATDNNNGIDSFYTPIQSNSYRTNKKCVSISFLGSVFYQPYEASYDMKIHSLRLKGNKAISEHSGLFVATELRKQCSKFSYGNQVSSTDLPKQRLLLPIQADGTPDWAFMEAFMKQVEDELLSEARPKLEAQLLEHIISLGALDDREWRVFALTEFFNPIKGNQNNMSSLIDGKLPLVSAKKGDNGIKTFVSPNKKSLFPQHCITLNLDGDGGAGLAFYQEYSFALDSHVVALYPKLPLDKFSLLFIARSISAQRSRFGHGRAINKSRFNHFLLMLPIQADGTPDWKFMSAFMKKIEQDTLSDALRYFKPKKCKQMLTGGVK